MIGGTRYQLRLEVNRQLRLARDISRAQVEISSGKKILAPSDDPAAAARISDIGRSQSNEAGWRSNLDKAAAISAQADGVLTSLENVYRRAKELMVAAGNQILSDDDRNAIALELRSLSEHVSELRDTRDSRGELLFPVGAVNAIPVGASLDLAPVATADAVFDTVPSPFGNRNLVNILADAATAVVGGAATAIDALMEEVSAGVTHLASMHAQQGARGNRIDSMIEQSESFKIIMTEERKGLEDADITEVIARLQAKELSLEAAQAALARVNRSNLFDLLG